MTNNKARILALAMILIMAGGVAYVMADSSIGSVEVTPEIPVIKDISFPLSAAPGQWLTLTFTIQYQGGIAAGDELYIDMYSAGVVPDLTYGGTPSSTVNIFDHYRAHWSNSLTDPWTLDGGVFNAGPAGVFQNPSTTPVPPVTDGTDIELSLQVRFDELADATNPWTIAFHLKYTDANDLSSKTLDETYNFDLAQYLGINIIQSTFDFGSIEQGQTMIPITVPTQGFLNMSVQSNTAYYIQVEGSDPDDGLGNSFAVGNIYQNSIDDSVSAVPLTSTPADIANLGLQPLTPVGTEDDHLLYLWISIPISAPVGTYTFTLTVTLVAA